MKKLISLVLALTMLLTLVACGGNPSKNTSGTDSSTDSQNDTEPSAEELDSKDPIKIGYLAWASGADAYFGLVAIAAL